MRGTKRHRQGKPRRCAPRTYRLDRAGLRPPSRFAIGARRFRIPRRAQMARHRRSPATKVSRYRMVGLMITRATLPRNQKLLMEKSMRAAEAEAVIGASAVNVVLDIAAASSRVGQIAALVATATAARAFGSVGFVCPDVLLRVRGATSNLRQELATNGATFGTVNGPTIFVTASAPSCAEDDVRVLLHRGLGGFVPADVPASFDVEGFAPAAILGASLAVTAIFVRRVLREPADGRSHAFEMLPADYTGPVADLDAALPAHLAFLGIGHLGQASLFCASLLGSLDGYRRYDMLDDQEIDPANYSTQLLVS